jgi:lactoylglutathione lyase
MTVCELNHVALHVRDVEAGAEFYRTVLRLKAMPRPAFDFAGAWFRVGTNQELHLIGDRQEPVYADHRGNHFALQVDNLAEWEAHLRKLGVDHRPAKLRPDGAWQVFLRDPDGHVVELFTPARA